MIVLDASAVIAVLNDEQGGARVAAVMRRAAISAVNYAEIGTHLVDGGVDAQAVDAILSALDLDVRPFEAGDAMRVAALRKATRRGGLSLGDRACIALAQRLSLPALTADRLWASLDLGVEIELIR